MADGDITFRELRPSQEELLAAINLVRESTRDYGPDSKEARTAWKLLDGMIMPPMVYDGEPGELKPWEKFVHG